MIRSWANGTAVAQNGASGASIYFPPVADHGCINQDPLEENAYYRFTCHDPEWQPISIEFVCKEHWADLVYAYLGIAHEGDDCQRQPILDK